MEYSKKKEGGEGSWNKERDELVKGKTSIRLHSSSLSRKKKLLFAFRLDKESELNGKKNKP